VGQLADAWVGVFPVSWWCAAPAPPGICAKRSPNVSPIPSSISTSRSQERSTITIATQSRMEEMRQSVRIMYTHCLEKLRLHGRPGGRFCPFRDTRSFPPLRAEMKALDGSEPFTTSSSTARAINVPRRGLRPTVEAPRASRRLPGGGTAPTRPNKCRDPGQPRFAICRRWILKAGGTCWPINFSDPRLAQTSCSGDHRMTARLLLPRDKVGSQST